MSATRPLRQFLGDLRAAIAVWARRPALPLLSAFIGFLLWQLGPLIERLTASPECVRNVNQCGRGETVWGVVILVLMIALAGWYGTERIWYLRAFRDEPVTASELYLLTRAFRWRFIRLGFIVGLLFFPFVVTAMFTSRSQEATIAVWTGSIAIDVLITFVTPALAFSTYRVQTAFGIGLSMIRRHWPATIGYILVPPFAVLLVSTTLGTRISVAGSIALTTLGGWLNLWFKGATARFYLRHHDIGETGAAFTAWAEREARAEGAKTRPEFDPNSPG